MNGWMNENEPAPGPHNNSVKQSVNGMTPPLAGQTDLIRGKQTIIHKETHTQIRHSET